MEGRSLAGRAGRAAPSAMESGGGRRVLVVGAGLAGLGAAQRLRGPGSLRLLEAAPRAGGRVCTRPFGTRESRGGGSGEGVRGCSGAAAPGTLAVGPVLSGRTRGWSGTKTWWHRGGDRCCRLQRLRGGTWGLVSPPTSALG